MSQIDHAMTAELGFGVLAGIEPRLLSAGGSVESAGSYADAGGYAPAPDPDRFLETVLAAGLLGRGGAGFPLGRKLSAVRGNCGRGVSAVVVANGEEGEPASVKDRWLLRHRPHLVLDGVRLAAHVVGADRAVVYVSDPDAAAAVSAAAAESAAGPVEVCTVAPGYVAGEESAAVRAVDGGPAKPTEKPPRPFESGVAGRPTLVSNVETLAMLPYLLRHGAEEFRALGTERSPGTYLATVTGVGTPGLYELPYGTPLPELLSAHGISTRQVRGVLMGGYFGGLVNRRALAWTLDHESVRAAGSGLGCGAVSVLSDDHCPVAVAAAVMAYFDRENAGQCGSCFNGTAAMSAALAALRDGYAGPDDLDRLRRWSLTLPKRGACGTLDGACAIARTLLDDFPDEVAEHRAGRCELCAERPYSALRPFEVETGAAV